MTYPVFVWCCRLLWKQKFVFFSHEIAFYWITFVLLSYEINNPRQIFLARQHLFQCIAWHTDRHYSQWASIQHHREHTMWLVRVLTYVISLAFRNIFTSVHHWVIYTVKGVAYRSGWTHAEIKQKHASISWIYFLCIRLITVLEYKHAYYSDGLVQERHNVFLALIHRYHIVMHGLFWWLHKLS